MKLQTEILIRLIVDLKPADLTELLAEYKRLVIVEYSQLKKKFLSCK
jgi:hypothetical protein